MDLTLNYGRWTNNGLGLIYEYGAWALDGRATKRQTNTNRIFLFRLVPQSPRTLVRVGQRTSGLAVAWLEYQITTADGKAGKSTTCGNPERLVWILCIEKVYPNYNDTGIEPINRALDNGPAEWYDLSRVPDHRGGILRTRDDGLVARIFYRFFSVLSFQYIYTVRPLS